MDLKKTISTTVQAGDTVTGTVKTSFATCLPLSPTGASASTASGASLKFGRTVRLDLRFLLTTSATPGNLTFTIDYGNGNSGATLTVLGTTGAKALPASLTNAVCSFRGTVVFAQTGSSAGICTASGDLVITLANNTTVSYPVDAVITSGTTGMVTGVDTYGTRYNLILASAQFSAAGNSMTLGAGSIFEEIE